MSIQKSLKKGFTLIELMVVIVIIGILAAVAIPKLFGMSAKAKAQEVGPAVGTWSKLQMAYKMETGVLGDAKKISYRAPGSVEATPGDGETSNFKYKVTGTSDDAADWEAQSLFSSDPCKEGAKWRAAFGTDAVEVPKMSIEASDAEGCFSLTPNYIKIGCGDKTLDKKAVDCVAKQ